MGRLIAIIAPILILVVLGIGGVIAVSAMKPEPEKNDEPRVGLNVFAEQVQTGSLTITVEAQGEVRPKREIMVAPQISGRVTYVSPDFVDGGFITRGQVLVRVEPADYELAVVRARSVVASAEQGLAREVAEAQLAQKDLDDLGLTDASPLARREPQLAEARAALDAAKAQLAEAELSLNRTAVIAPFDGRVRDRMTDIGQFVSPASRSATSSPPMSWKLPCPSRMPTSASSACRSPSPPPRAARPQGRVQCDGWRQAAHMGRRDRPHRRRHQFPDPADQCLCRTEGPLWRRRR